MSDQENEQPELDLSNSDVVTKYKAAAEICNKAIAQVIDAVKDGAKVVDLCKLGDETIAKECANIFKGKQIEKGIAFPTCVSINSVVGHFSPMSDDATALKIGDLVKIDLGAHIDGFVGTQAQTVQVTADAADAITGRAADVVAAARAAFEAAIRLIRPGKKVSDVAPKLAACVEPFNCHLVEGVMSHQMKQFVIDGNKVVLNRTSPEHRVEDAEFEPNEVYAVDIVVSTGEGKPRMLDEKQTTVYKRALDMAYNLKLKASRQVLNEIGKRAPTMPFSVRCLEEVEELRGGARNLGLVECLNHGLLHAYPVLHEKNGELVAQVKGTILLMPSGTDKVTTAAAQPCTSEHKIEDAELLQLLQSSLKPRKKNKKKAGAKEGAEGAAE